MDNKLLGTLLRVCLHGFRLITFVQFQILKLKRQTQVLYSMTLNFNHRAIMTICSVHFKRGKKTYANYCDDQSCLHTLTFCWLLHVYYCVVAIIIILLIIIIIIINSTVIARVLSPNFLLNKKLTFRTKLFGQLLRSLLHLLLFMIYHIHECNIHDKFNGKFFEWPFGTDKFCCHRCMLLGQVIKKNI